MTLFELLFICLFLGTMGGLLRAAFLIRNGSAGKILVPLAAVWGCYFAVLLVSDLLAKQKVTKAGDEQCFDEMCFAVTDVQVAPTLTPGDKVYAVSVRESSHSQGRTQSEGGLRGRLYANGRYFNVSEPAQRAYEAVHGPTPGLTVRLAPGQSAKTVLVFEVPGDVTGAALTLDHGFTPGYFVIGESPFLHPPDILLLSKE